ncbi:MAG: tRNA (adenosine(37)-N6)-threonylcarbamoyltransferase complex ATPase subunit type 1 TsaE [Kiloniellaceae bacterium]
MAAPQPRPSSLDFALPDEAATAALARDLAQLAAPGDVIALCGELGTGKTTFARAFINALPRPADRGPEESPGARRPGKAGVPEEVPSPTFTLLQTYEREPAPVWHFDLYRLERPAEVYELGLEEALGQAISLIEWPERLGPLLPPGRLEVRLVYADRRDARRAILSGAGTWPARLRRLGRHD